MAVKYYHNFPKLARDSGFLLKDNDSDGFIDWRFIGEFAKYLILELKLKRKCQPTFGMPKSLPDTKIKSIFFTKNKSSSLRI